MNNKAVIYVRTSSEHQGEKSSPLEQEADCRHLAEEKGLIVIGVYRDIEKYRVKNKMVEPSGTRYDRPGLVAMLNDTAKGKFDVILAWREDRLYRGMRAMLMVLEAIQEHKVNVMLARETFDPKIAPLRAWVAQMELDGMKERLTMGVKARLKAGKANTGQDRYGYRRVGENIEIVELEAVWVRKIFEWYVQDVPILHIRERLIAANAPQKGSSIPRRIQWAKSSIQAILGAAKEYAFGIKIQSRKGEIFQIPIDPIIDTTTYDLFTARRTKNKTYPAHRHKHDYLLGGYLKCACNLTWGTRTDTKRYNRAGILVERKTPIGIYYCPQPHREIRPLECAKSVTSRKADSEAWEKICRAIDKPEYLYSQARILVDELRSRSDNLHEDESRIKKELQVLSTERQWLITQARKNTITSADLEYQLSTMTMQEVDLKRELLSLGQAINTNMLGNWEAKFNEYLADLRIGIEELRNADPQTDEERHHIFLLKRKVVETLLAGATIDKNREVHVTIRLKLLDIVDNDPDSGNSNPAASTRSGGICSRKRSTHAHRHRCAFCG